MTKDYPNVSPTLKTRHLYDLLHISLSGYIAG